MTKIFQKDDKFLIAMVLGSFSVKLNHLKAELVRHEIKSTETTHMETSMTDQ